MKTLLATLAALGLAMPAAAACGIHKTTSHDQMTTASIQAPLSTRDDAEKDATAEAVAETIADEIREEPAE